MASMNHQPLPLQATVMQVKMCCSKCEEKAVEECEEVEGVVKVVTDQPIDKVIAYGPADPHVLLKKMKRHLDRHAMFWHSEPGKQIAPPLYAVSERDLQEIERRKQLLRSQPRREESFIHGPQSRALGPMEGQQQMTQYPVQKQQPESVVLVVNHVEGANGRTMVTPEEIQHRQQQLQMTPATGMQLQQRHPHQPHYRNNQEVDVVKKLPPGEGPPIVVQAHGHRVEAREVVFIPVDAKDGRPVDPESIKEVREDGHVPHTPPGLGPNTKVIKNGGVSVIRDVVFIPVDAKDGTPVDPSKVHPGTSMDPRRPLPAKNPGSLAPELQPPPNLVPIRTKEGIVPVKAIRDPRDFNADPRRQVQDPHLYSTPVAPAETRARELQEQRSPREGEYRSPRGSPREGEYRPREGGYRSPRGSPREGEYRSPREGDYRPRDIDYRSPREGDYNGLRDYRTQREGEYRSPREGEYDTRSRDVFGPRNREEYDTRPHDVFGPRNREEYDTRPHDVFGPRNREEYDTRRDYGEYGNGRMPHMQSRDDSYIGTRRSPARRDGEFPGREGPDLYETTSKPIGQGNEYVDANRRSPTRRAAEYEDIQNQMHQGRTAGSYDDRRSPMGRRRDDEYRDDTRHHGNDYNGTRSPRLSPTRDGYNDTHQRSSPYASPRGSPRAGRGPMLEKELSFSTFGMGHASRGGVQEPGYPPSHSDSFAFGGNHAAPKSPRAGDSHSTEPRILLDVTKVTKDLGDLGHQREMMNENSYGRPRERHVSQYGEGDLRDYETNDAHYRGNYRPSQNYAPGPLGNQDGYDGQPITNANYVKHIR